jgi:DNA (cytosine-5)-methyltransferase 1
MEKRGMERSILRKSLKGKIKLKKEVPFRFIDLFAGIGGLRMGFEAAGGTCVFSSEWDKEAAKTYEQNHGEKPAGDITKVKNREIPDHDILIGGFPCQAFSVAGLKRGLEDDRGSLFLEIVRILKNKKPKAFVLENVKHLLGHNKGETYETIKVALEKIDGGAYKVTEEVMNSCIHGGVPQNRERVFIVGMRDKKEFLFPNTPIQMAQLSTLLERDVDKSLYYDLSSPVGKALVEAEEENGVYQWRRNYLRVNRRGISPTLMANMGTGGHNIPIIKDENGFRKLTVRECLRLQGFPEEFTLSGVGKAQSYKQVGNSVTFPVVVRIAQEITGVL